jgi:hypothetical protein
MPNELNINIMTDDLSDEAESDDNSSPVRSKKRKTPSKESRPKKKRKTVQAETDFDITQKKIRPYLDAYRNEILSAEQFIAELSKFREQFEEIDFLSLSIPSSESVIASVLKASPQEDIFFQWLLDEFEACVEQLPEYESEAINLISILCADEACLAAVLNRPTIRAMIQSHFAIPLIELFFKSRKIKVDPFVFLNTYFSQEVIERVKVESVFTKFTTTAVTFLDMLASEYMEYIPTLWMQGFRSSNTHKFNRDYFEEDSKQVSDEKRAQAFNIIASQDACNGLLAFAAKDNPMTYFLKNKAIDLDLFKRLLEKSNATPDVNVVMNCFEKGHCPKLYTSKVPYFNNFIEKIIYSLSLLPDTALQAPARSQFLMHFNTRLVNELYRNDFQGAGDFNIRQLQPEPTLADEILFYCADSIILKSKGKYRAQLKKLFEFLSGNSAKQSSLFNVLYYTYLIQALDGVAKPSTSTGLMLFLTEFLGKQFKSISTDEVNALLNKNILFLANFTIVRYNKIVAAKKLSERGSFLRAKIDLFANILAELIAFIPKKIELTAPTCYQLANLLLMQIVLSTSDNASLEIMIKKFLSYFDEIAGDVIATVLAYTLTGLARLNKVDCQLIDIATAIEPTWINYLSSEFNPNGPEYNLLSFLFKKVLNKEEQIAEKNARVIVYLLGKVGEQTSFTFPIIFLNEVAERYLNLQKRAQLSESVQKSLEQIYNLCIHRVQGAEQEKEFEEIRTQLLLKYDVDPTKDAQAIHTTENHAYADKIYHAWMQALGATEQECTMKLTEGYKAFVDYLANQRNTLVKRLVTPNQDSSQLADYIYFLTGDRSTILSTEFQEIQRQMSVYPPLFKYLETIGTRARALVTSEMSQQTKKIIEDAKKLTNLISMIAYYSIIAQAPSPFTIHDGAEALHILFAELVDQVENPSCDQGPFMRFLIALEPAAEFKFPYLTRRNVQFYVKEYINNYYDQLPQSGKNQLIRTIYECVEDKETLEEIDSIPENVFSFLGQVFLEENTERMGFISVKEINDLFFLERPAQYHPKIVEALNQYHQEQKNKTKLSGGTYDLFGLFGNNNGNDEDDMNVDWAPSL